MDIGVDISGFALLGLILILQVVLFLVALALGCWSLLLLRRPIDPRRGFRLALIAVVFSILVEAGSALYLVPERFQNARPEIYLPLLSLQIGLCGVVFWGLAGSRRISGTRRLAIAILAIGLAMGAVLSLDRWERRRVMLDWAESFANEAGGWMEASRISKDDPELTDYFLRQAQHREAVSRAYRWAADHPAGPVPVIPPAPSPDRNGRPARR
jgi:hypothetical protein